MSWLDFNQRVLSLAGDTSLPLLERIKFLAIFHSNLDEFFMVRVANLLRRMDLGFIREELGEMSNQDLLTAITQRVRAMGEEVDKIFLGSILPDLKAYGIEILSFDEVDSSTVAELDQFFDQRIFPILTPLVVDPSHPFPHISGLSLNFGIFVRDPKSGRQFIRLKIPQNVDRFIAIKGSREKRFVRVEELIAKNLAKLFPGAKVEEFFLFRVTRNQDLEIDEDEESEDLLALMQEELEKRRFGDVVRLEVERVSDEKVLQKLMDEFAIDRFQIYKTAAPLDLSSLFALYDVDFPQLKFEPFQPVTHPRLKDHDDGDADSFFANIQSGEILLHHPYHSFSNSVARFVALAAKDPKVLAIKQTLYRTSGDSPIMHSLIEAARAGKQVLAVIEIRARFDETANVKWAQALEDAGAHVVYGILGLKTHAKASLIIRDEGGTLRRYSHVGTGNYHPRTARLYEDLGLLSADETLGNDLTTLFNQLSGLSPEAQYERLLVAPKFLRAGITERIEREISHHLAGKASRIRLKMNSIIDHDIIRALYRAVNAGVPVEINARGICSFDMRVVESAGKIHINSILGRFLEHSRVYNFHNDGKNEYLIGSADMMDRNLNRRIEILVQITDETQKRELDDLLSAIFSRKFRHWSLNEQNEWLQKQVSDDGVPLVDLQEHYIERVNT